MTGDRFDIAVIGAGVFGSWIAYHFQKSGNRVVLLDAYGPGNSRASSGGESRIIRMTYGPDDLYTRSSNRSLRQWQDLFNENEASCRNQPLFHKTGFLLLARENDTYAQATAATLARNDIRFDVLDRKELSTRYPQLDLGSISWAIWEPDSGVLMARRAVQEVVARGRDLGVEVINEPVLPPQSTGKLELVKTTGNRSIRAELFVFACGPWLPKVFPNLLSELIHVTRQEVFFIGAPERGPRYDPSCLPVWIDFTDLVYCIPDVDGRGLKIAIDAHGPVFDPDTGDRVVSSEGLVAIKEYLSRRLPALKNAPILETRVCQYENTSTGDFLIDLHPDFENVWIAGGGSGHGFKHGPFVGEYLSGRVSGVVPTEPRFLLQTKGTFRERKVF